MNFNEGKIVNSKYKIIKKIGSGATAEVFLAENIVNGMNVALKIQNQKDEISNMDKRFELEAETLMKIQHQNVVETYDYFVFEDRRIIVMEYLRGKTLSEIINDRGFLNTKEIIKYGREVLSALVQIHALKVIHRDLKPDNIIINLENKVKLMDFGIIQTSENQNITKQSNVIGTVQYLAPEIFKGVKANEKTEMFSVGVIFYKMVTGVTPFKGSSPEETARKIINLEPTKPSRINPDVNAFLELLIMGLLEKNPENRLPDARTVLAKLERIETMMNENFSDYKNLSKKIKEIEYNWDISKQKKKEDKKKFKEEKKKEKRKEKKK